MRFQEAASRAAPSIFVLLFLGASLGVTIAFFSNSLHSLEDSYKLEIEEINNRISSLEKKQAKYQKATQTLSRLVVKSLNATDEYINNVTSTVSEAKDVIDQDIATVSEIADSQNTLLAVQFAGMFTVLVILVSGYHLSQHLRCMHTPVVQRKIMAVLWMTPIYAVTSWLSMVFPQAEPYLAVIREFYESYCVYTFLSFLISVLGRGDRWAVVELLEKRADRLSPPDKLQCRLKCLDKLGKRRRVPNEYDGGGAAGVSSTSGSNLVSGLPTGASSPPPPGNIRRVENYPGSARAKAEAVLDQCQFYAMQFVLLRPITAIGWLISNKFVDPNGFLDWSSPQIYITILTNVSIFFAFRGLVKFYHATRRDLEWCNPWPKFLCIKGVVFMTFWQKMVISIVVNVGYADQFDSNDEASEFVMSAQNFLICLEMLFAATAHCFVFATDEWEEGYRESQERRKQIQIESHFGDGVALRDFIQDVKTVMASKQRRKRRRRAEKRAAALSSPSENSLSKDDDEPSSLYDLALSPTSMDSIDADHNLTRETSMTDSVLSEDYEEELSTPVKSNVNGTDTSAMSRPRAETADSNYSDGGDFVGSWERIEKYINEHGSEKTAHLGKGHRRESSSDSSQEIV